MNSLREEDDGNIYDFPPAEQPNENIKSKNKIIKFNRKALLIITTLCLIIIIIIFIISILKSSKKKNNDKNNENNDNSDQIKINNKDESNNNINTNDNNNNYESNLKIDGGFFIGTYIVKSDEQLSYFNPSFIGIKNGEFEVYNISRILQENIESPNKNKEIKIKIKFNKILKNMDKMFEGYENLTKIDLSGLISYKIESMDSTFLNCKSLEDINFTGFNSLNVKNMKKTFEGCKELTGLDLSSFETQNLESMEETFKDCQTIFILNLSNFKFKNEIKLDKTIFSGDNNLAIIIIDNNDTKEKFRQIKNFNDSTDIKCISGYDEKCKDCNTFLCKSCNEGYFLPEIKYPIKCKYNIYNNNSKDKNKTNIPITDTKYLSSEFDEITNLPTNDIVTHTKSDKN